MDVRKDRQGRQSRGTGRVVLYVTEGLSCMELAVSCFSDTVESFWVRIKGQANKVDVVVRVYYKPHGQDDNTD